MLLEKTQELLKERPEFEAKLAVLCSTRDGLVKSLRAQAQGVDDEVKEATQSTETKLRDAIQAKHAFVREQEGYMQEQQQKRSAAKDEIEDVLAQVALLRRYQATEQFSLEQQLAGLRASLTLEDEDFEAQKAHIHASFFVDRITQNQNLAQSEYNARNSATELAVKHLPLQDKVIVVRHLG